MAFEKRLGRYGRMTFRTGRRRHRGMPAMAGLTAAVRRGRPTASAGQLRRVASRTSRAALGRLVRRMARGAVRMLAVNFRD